MSKAPILDRSPLVSVILCVFNGEKQVASAIDDILAQTYLNFELIISDDASTDGTAGILAKYSRDPRVRVFRQPLNLGFVANKNFAIGQGRGDFITQQDHDDRSDRTRLERQVQALKDTGMLVAACGVRRINKYGQEVSRIAAQYDIVIDEIPDNGLPFFFSPTMFHRAVWQQHGPFQDYFSKSFGEDYYFISCVLCSHPIAVISDCLYDYIDTPASITNRARSVQAFTMAPILKMLANQNEATGTNDLAQGRFDLLAAEEKRILADKSYIAEQYRVYAARATDHSDFQNAVRLIKMSALLKPLSMKLVRTIIYTIRCVVKRSN